ncbi:MAG: PKD domain-containing protein [Candidatus Thermoplasmatota archaeon]
MKGKNTKTKIILFLLIITLLLNPFILEFTVKAGEAYIEFTPSKNLPPNKPELINPQDNAENLDLSVTLKVHITDQDQDPNQTITVYFYDSSNNLIGSDISAHGFNASIIWSGLNYETTYNWYAIANDSLNENQSNTWSFTTKPEPSTPPPYNPPTNTPPIANITAPKQGYIKQKISLYGNNSYDSDGEVVAYRWDFNSDNTWDTNWTTKNWTQHTFTKPGNHTITLQVKDNTDLTDTDTKVIQILNKKPVAIIHVDEKGFVNHTMPFFANESYDPDGKIISYRWNFNNDNVWDTEWINNSKYHYSYNKSGNKTVKLQVKDNHEAKNTSHHNITILSSPKDENLPVAKIKVSYDGRIDEKIRFDASQSYDPDGNITTFTWYFDDGNISHKKNPHHSYKRKGIYNVTLKVTDDDNYTAYDTVTIKITKNKKQIPEKTLTSTIIWIIIVASAATIIALLLFFKPPKAMAVLNKLKNSVKNSKNENLKHSKNRKKTDIQKIMEIDGVGSSTVDSLKQGNINYLEELSNLSEEELLSINGIGKKTAEKIKKGLPKLLE